VWGVTRLVVFLVVVVLWWGWGAVLPLPLDRVHRIGQDEPVTAWRIIAAHTIDSKIAELIDAKQGLAARALDGSDQEIVSADSVQLDALQHLLRQALDGSL
ncbi:MAG: hypothetical protein ABWY36_03090, partial [Leifsonia sp.]